MHHHANNINSAVVLRWVLCIDGYATEGCVDVYSCVGVVHGNTALINLLNKIHICISHLQRDKISSA